MTNKVNDKKEKNFVIHPASIKRVKDSFERSKKKSIKQSNFFIEVK